MPPEEPSWWYAEDGAGQAPQRLLAPVGWLYGRMAERRFRKGEAYRSPLPVICVGNFTAGGTGKTPLAAAIGEHLAAAGGRPVFLSRGYGGAERGPLLVDAGRDRAAEVGDEPLLLARTAPVVIARNRRAGMRLIEGLAQPADVVIMDDGLQNAALAKDLTIALIDGARGIGNGAVIPAGPLRAPMEFQMDLVDAIVVNGRGKGARETHVLDTLRQQFPGPVLEAGVEAKGETDWLGAQPVLAYSGIGHPARFFALLARLGADVVHTQTYGDHHQFKDRQAQELLEAARSRGAQLVTTEKDWVRLSGEGGALEALQLHSRPLAIQLRFSEQDQGRLDALVDAAVKTGGGR